MEWYKTLGIHQKINLKILAIDICGVSWESLCKIFTQRQVIRLLHRKLKIEGFDV